jgi:hypothetical protein
MRNVSVVLMLIACAMTPAPSAGPKPTAPPTNAALQLRWLNASKAQVSLTSKRLDARFGYVHAPKTLCDAAASAGVVWAQRYCPNWGQNAVYLRWAHSQGMFAAANQSLQNAIYALKWRTLTPAEMRVYGWGMHEWSVSEATLEKALNDDLASDVRQLQLLDKVQAATTQADRDAAQAAVDAFEKARPAYAYKVFDGYVAFTSVNPYSFQPRVRVHTNPAIASPPTASP